MSDSKKNLFTNEVMMGKAERFSVSEIIKSSIEDKEGHIRICLEKDVESTRTTGFENFHFANNPLPEINFEDIDISCEFLGKKIRAPFVMSPLTGGCRSGKKINRNLAMAAQELGLAMAVGSQRLALEDASLSDSYQIRDVAPDIPLLANLGAIYLNYGYGLDACERAVAMIDADALMLYLNPMQKVFQGGRVLDFRGLQQKIAYICQHLSVPVIVKEVGFGISPDASVLLRDAGVKMLDIAGAGGTSWVKITRFLKGEASEREHEYFDDWGIPTSEALVSVRKVVGDLPIIASGGIRNGLDMAKALALGADYVGMALPLLLPALNSAEEVKKKVSGMMIELKSVMFCCGISDVSGLREKGVLERKRSVYGSATGFP